MATRKVIDAVLCILYEHQGIALREACAYSGLKENDDIYVETVTGREKAKVIYVLEGLYVYSEDGHNNDMQILEALKIAVFYPKDKALKRVLAKIEVKELEEPKEEEIG